MNVLDATTKSLAARAIVDYAGYNVGYQACKKSGASETIAQKCGLASGFIVDVANNVYSMDDKMLNGMKKGTSAVINYVKNEINRISEAGKKATTMMNRK
ncbi:hypothetical protein [uncultured Anoxybacillus sp.]|uniref:hypothetical protein n=1 Tax=uncultured Anoxybacillus sp. TaxID=263860 RepID=UPI00261E8C30|nr:hypothetical protein [uncultured Anoxybacillus sp.]